jgi:hypothetical protein
VAIRRHFLYIVKRANRNDNNTWIVEVETCDGASASGTKAAMERLRRAPISWLSTHPIEPFEREPGMGNEQRTAVPPTALTMAMAHKDRRIFGPIPNAPAQAAAFKDEISAHDVLLIMIVQHHNSLASGCLLWVQTVQKRLSIVIRRPGVEF